MSDSGPRLESSISAMKLSYPQFSLAGAPIGTGPVPIWKGWVQPIQNRESLEQLLDDVYHNRRVQILPGGEVQHLAECEADHTDHEWMEDIINPYVRYKLELQYRGDSTHPRARVLDPFLPRSKWKHTLGDGAICPYAPWEGVWFWKDHTVVDFMDHVLIWLVKSTVWSQARVWLGEERGHDREYLLEAIKPANQCWCGSGRRYDDCHRNKDHMSVVGSLVGILREFDRRNPYFIEIERRRSLQRSRKAVSIHQPNTVLN
ncbi:MAG: SEC-C metal-binding domain-containing protein [Pyrinomonadaceae bacterium]